MSRIGDVVDSVVGIFSPAYALQRKAARAYLSTFEGAVVDHTRGRSWMGSRLSTDSALEEDLPTLRHRSRAMYRDDSWGGTVDTLVDHIVGTGFTPQCRIPEKIVGTEAARVFREELEGVYEQWSPAADVTGRISLWQQTRLMVRHLQFDGEAIAVVSDDIEGNRAIPLAIEVIDPERLETPPGLIGNPRVRMGVEKDSAGRIVAYWIRRTHPGDTLEVSEEFERVPAARVLHVFERWFAGQTRGLPRLCRALNKVKDAKDIDESEIIASQVQACFAAFVKRPGNPATAARAAATATDGTDRYEDIRPGSIKYLGPGDEITFASPNRGNSFAALQEWNYRRIAAAVNVPYEVLTKNWNGMSFVGGRLVLAGFRLDVRGSQKLIKEQFLTPVWQRMVDECVFLGRCSIEPRNWAMRQWVYHRHTWTSPAWNYAVNPGEEITANIDAVNNNQKTLAEVIGENAGDLEEVLDQREIEVGLMRKKGILPPEQQAAEAAVVAAAQPQDTGGDNGQG